jgi:parvulin-like peptidyl-prolyl isomerase
VEKLAFSLEKGENSDVIKTEAGYEIIKLMDRKGGELRPLDEVGQGIKMTLTKQKFEREKRNYYKKAGVKVTGI